MASFSLHFPDDEILNILGDDIRVFNPGGGFTDVRGEFEFKYMEDELGEAVSIQYPTLTVNNSVAPLFGKKYKVEFDDSMYVVINQQPSDVGKTLVILRNS